MFCFFLTTIGWFAWLAFLDAVYAAEPSGPYNIKYTFRNQWGKDAAWWATLFVVLGALGLMELTMKTIRRNLMVAGLWQWPPWRNHGLSENVEEWDLELWQELEQDPMVRARLKILARDGDPDEELIDEVLLGDGDVGEEPVEVSPSGAGSTAQKSSPKSFVFSAWRKMIPSRS